MVKGLKLLKKYESRILKMPESINIEGISFRQGGGSGSSLDEYILRFRRADVIYYPPGKMLEAREKLGFTQLKVIFEWKSNALRPRKVEISNF